MSDEIVALYYEKLSTQGFRPRTVDTYKWALKRYLRFCTQHSHSFLTAETDFIARYYKTLITEKLSSSRQHLNSRGVYNFYEWLAQKGYLLINPSPNPLRRVEKKLPRNIPNQAEVQQIFTMLKTSDDLYEKRDALILDIAYSCGLRLSELTNLTVADIDVGSQTVRVRKGKGGYDRIVPFGEKTLANIREYLLHTRPKLLRGGNSISLFISYRKGGLTSAGITDRLMRIQKMCTTKSRITTHAFRHACATDLLRNGAPLQDISELLGHARIETTKVYTHLVNTDLKTGHKEFHPRG